MKTLKEAKIGDTVCVVKENFINDNTTQDDSGTHTEVFTIAPPIKS